MSGRYVTRSATKSKRNPLEDVNVGQGTPGAQKKKNRRSSSARKSSSSINHRDNENAEVSVESAKSVDVAELQNLSELNSSTMSIGSTGGGGGGGDTVSLGHLAKLMESPASSKSVRSQGKTSRRQTADPDALKAMFNSSSSEEEDEDDDNNTSANANANVDAMSKEAESAPAAKEAASATFTSPVPEPKSKSAKKPTPKPLKSCISARKSRARSERKGRGVRFGSPDAAEFHKDAATSSVTPLPKSFSRQRYQMASPETQAKEASAEALENDRILAEAEGNEGSVNAVSSKLTASARRRSMRRKSAAGEVPVRYVRKLDHANANANANANAKMQKCNSEC